MTDEEIIREAWGRRQVSLYELRRVGSHRMLPADYFDRPFERAEVPSEKEEVIDLVTFIAHEDGAVTGYYRGASVELIGRQD